MTETEVLHALHKAARMVTGLDQPIPRLDDRIDALPVDSLDFLMVIVACEDMLETYFSADPGGPSPETISDVVAGFLNGIPFGLNQ